MQCRIEGCLDGVERVSHKAFFFLRRSCWLEFVWSEISPCLDSSTDPEHVSQPCKTLLTVPSETVHTSTGTQQSKYDEYKPTYIRRQVTRGDIFWAHQRHIKRCGSTAYPTSWVSSTSPPPQRTSTLHGGGSGGRRGRGRRVR